MKHRVGTPVRAGEGAALDQLLAQVDGIAQLAPSPATADMQLGRDLGDDVLVPVDRPVDAVGFILGRPPCVQLAHRLKPPGTGRVLLARRHPDRRDHASVIDTMKRV